MNGYLTAQPVRKIAVALVISILPTICVADDLEKGKAIYNGVGACASCHGALGKGDGAAAAALNPKPRSFAAGDYKIDTDKDGKAGTEKDILDVLTNGAAAYGGSPLMAGRKDIPEADLKELVKYVLSLKQK